MWPRAAALAEVFWTGAENGEYPRSKFRMTNKDELISRFSRGVPEDARYKV